MQRLAISPSQIQDRHITLTPEQYHYLVRVLRLQTGDRFIALDGRGGAWWATLDQKNAELGEILKFETELPVAVTLIVAMPKGSGFEEIVRQGTELGVAVFQPVTSDRTLLKPSPHKLQRWRKIATEAAEQCERAIIPTIGDPVPFTEAIQRLAATPTQGYIAAARSEAVLPLITALPSEADAIALATGPEGGWTHAEIEMAIATGFQPVSLGKRILRAVTAPIAGMGAIAAYYESDCSPKRKH